MGPPEGGLFRGSVRSSNPCLRWAGRSAPRGVWLVRSEWASRPSPRGKVRLAIRPSAPFVGVLRRALALLPSPEGRLRCFGPSPLLGGSEESLCSGLAGEVQARCGIGLHRLWRSVPGGAGRRWPAPRRWNRWPKPAVVSALEPGGLRASTRGCPFGARGPVALLGARGPVAAAGGPPSSLGGRGRLGCSGVIPCGPGRGLVRLASDEDRTVCFGHVKDRFLRSGSSW